jgi:hypothetical protein
LGEVLYSYAYEISKYKVVLKDWQMILKASAKTIGWSITSIGKKSAVTAKVLELKTI